MGLASLDASIRFFEEALEYSARIADALLDTRRVLQDWSAKARAEQDAQKLNANHIPEYAGEDTHGYVEDTRPNGLQQPDTKKIRRGVSVRGSPMTMFKESDLRISVLRPPDDAIVANGPRPPSGGEGRTGREHCVMLVDYVCCPSFSIERDESLTFFWGGGVDYAKLTRKLSKNAMGNVGGALGGGRKPNSPLP